MDKIQHLGLWWLPSAKETTWAGNLTLDENSYSELELLSQEIRSDFVHHELLHGFTAGEVYSAIGVFNNHFNIRMGSSFGVVDRYLVRDVIKGLHLDHHEQKFRRFSFSVSGLQDWSRLTGISKAYSQSHGRFSFDVEFTRTAPEVIEVETTDLRFRFFSTLRMPDERWSMSLAEDTQIHVTSKEPMSIGDWLYEVALPFRRLIQFCAKTGGTLQRLAVSSKESDSGSGGARDPDWFNLIRSGTKQFDLDSSHLKVQQPFLKLNDFADNADALQKWYEFDRSFREPLTAVLDSTLGTPTPDYVFFVYARLLERLVSNYPQAELCDKATMRKIISFAKSLVDQDKREALGQKIGSQRRSDAKVPLKACLNAWLSSMSNWNPSDNELDWIATKVVKTRNHFAHQGLAQPDPKSIRPEEFDVFTDLVQTLVDLEIGSRLGFTGELVMSRLEETHQWRSARVVSRIWKDYQSEGDYDDEPESDWPEI